MIDLGNMRVAFRVWVQPSLLNHDPTGVRAIFFKHTPIIYLVFEKNDLFINLIEQNVYIFIYCSLIVVGVLEVRTLGGAGVSVLVCTRGAAFEMDWRKFGGVSVDTSIF